MLAQLTAPPSPLLSPLEWLVVQAELTPAEAPDFLAYLADVERGDGILHHPDSAPYHLTRKAERLITHERITNT